MSSRIGEHSCWSAANGELHLPLDPDGPGDPELPRRLDRVLEQRGLADARLAVHHQHRRRARRARPRAARSSTVALTLPAEQLLARCRRDHARQHATSVKHD